VVKNRLSNVAGYTYTQTRTATAWKSLRVDWHALLVFEIPRCWRRLTWPAICRPSTSFNGQRLARKHFPAQPVSYYLSNHLGTPSVIANASGNLKATSDYYSGNAVRVTFWKLCKSPCGLGFRDRHSRRRHLKQVEQWLATQDEKMLAQGTFLQWAVAAYDLAIRNTYVLPADLVLGDDYVNKMFLWWSRS
jgi:hypothetical protein